MKTVIDKGKEYQVNTVYSLKDGTHVVLDGPSGSDSGFAVSRIDGDGIDWRVEELFPSKLVTGTIKEVPIELKDGAAYQFDWCAMAGCRTHKYNVGVYYAKDSTMLSAGGTVALGMCTNIVKLVPEVK